MNRCPRCFQIACPDAVDGETVLIVRATHAGIGQGGIDDRVFPVHGPTFFISFNVKSVAPPSLADRPTRSRRRGPRRRFERFNPHARRHGILTPSRLRDMGISRFSQKRRSLGLIVGDVLRLFAPCSVENRSNATVRNLRPPRGGRHLLLLAVWWFRDELSTLEPDPRMIDSPRLPEMDCRKITLARLPGLTRTDDGIKGRASFCIRYSRVDRPAAGST